MSKFHSNNLDGNGSKSILHLSRINNMDHWFKFILILFWLIMNGYWQWKYDYQNQKAIGFGFISMYRI